MTDTPDDGHKHDFVCIYARESVYEGAMLTACRSCPEINFVIGSVSGRIHVIKTNLHGIEAALRAQRREKMLKEKNDGCPAVSVGELGGTGHPGMSLRDWFAGQALVGVNASPALFEAVTSACAGSGAHYERLARHAYMQADAMLEARKPK